MSQKKYSSELRCHHTYIGKILDKYLYIKKRKNQKISLMNDLQKAQARLKCRRILEKFGYLDFFMMTNNALFKVIVLRQVMIFFKDKTFKKYLHQSRMS